MPLPKTACAKSTIRCTESRVARLGTMPAATDGGDSSDHTRFEAASHGICGHCLRFTPGYPLCHVGRLRGPRGSVLELLGIGEATCAGELALK